MVARIGALPYSALVALAFVAVAALGAAGCTHVAPYERGRLAHPTMTQGGETAGAEHVHAVHEGAAGGGSLGQGGCGCN